MMAFGQYLRTVRQAHGLSLRQLAAAVGLSPSYISAVEKGVTNPPTANVLQRLSAVLPVGYSELLAQAWKCPHCHGTGKAEIP